MESKRDFFRGSHGDFQHAPFMCCPKSFGRWSNLTNMSFFLVGRLKPPTILVGTWLTDLYIFIYCFRICLLAILLYIPLFREHSPTILPVFRDYSTPCLCSDQNPAQVQFLEGITLIPFLTNRYFMESHSRLLYWTLLKSIGSSHIIW